MCHFSCSVRHETNLYKQRSRRRQISWSLPINTFNINKSRPTNLKLAISQNKSLFNSSKTSCLSKDPRRHPRCRSGKSPSDFFKNTHPKLIALNSPQTGTTPEITVTDSGEKKDEKPEKKDKKDKK